MVRRTVVSTRSFHCFIFTLYVESIHKSGDSATTVRFCYRFSLSLHFLLLLVARITSSVGWLVRQLAHNTEGTLNGITAITPVHFPSMLGFAWPACLSFRAYTFIPSTNTPTHGHAPDVLLFTRWPLPETSGHT